MNGLTDVQDSFLQAKGRLMIKIDEQERKAHRQLMAKLRREEKMGIIN